MQTSPAVEQICFNIVVSSASPRFACGYSCFGLTFTSSLLPFRLPSSEDKYFDCRAYIASNNVYEYHSAFVPDIFAVYDYNLRNITKSVQHGKAAVVGPFLHINYYKFMYSHLDWSVYVPIYT